MSEQKKLNLEKTVELLVQVANNTFQGIHLKKYFETYNPATIWFQSDDAKVGDWFYANEGLLEYTEPELFLVGEGLQEGEKTPIPFGDFPKAGPQGIPGVKGDTPVISINGNGYWTVDGQSTGVKARGPQGERGAQGVAGEPGVGVNHISTIDSLLYNPTIGTSGNYNTITTFADIDFYVGEELVTKLFEFKFKIPKYDEVPEVIQELAEYIEVDGGGSVIFGHDVYADGNLQAGNDVEVGRNLYIDDMTKLQDPDGNQLLKQADWNQTVTTAPDYIKNKPTIPAAAPVSSVNNKTGAVVLNYSDVGADASGSAQGVQSNLNSHTGNTSNPHSVTKSQVGLSNVANVLQYSASNPPPYPVTSVNNQTGAVTGLATSTDLQQGLATRQAVLSAAQINACNSGITASKVSAYDGYASTIADKVSLYMHHMTKSRSMDIYVVSTSATVPGLSGGSISATDLKNFLLNSVSASGTLRDAEFWTAHYFGDIFDKKILSSGTYFSISEDEETGSVYISTRTIYSASGITDTVTQLQ